MQILTILDISNRPPECGSREAGLDLGIECVRMHRAQEMDFTHRAVSLVHRVEVALARIRPTRPRGWRWTRMSLACDFDERTNGHILSHMSAIEVGKWMRMASVTAPFRVVTRRSASSRT
jgi:hypothetical protein